MEKKISPLLWVALVAMACIAAWLVFKDSSRRDVESSPVGALATTASTASPTVENTSPLSGEFAGFSKAAPFVNSLGMKFVPVPGTKVLMCVHETRNGDYAKYADENTGVETSWQQVKTPEGVLVGAGDDHPVVNVSWLEASAFCAWLSKKENRAYRLPTDREWSGAVGIEDDEAADATPEILAALGSGSFAWGAKWPPPPKFGNFADSAMASVFPSDVWKTLPSYTDGFATTAPVMSFSPNSLGIYDLDGNVTEWCMDWYDSKQSQRSRRGSAWVTNLIGDLKSSWRCGNAPGFRRFGGGFRCVLDLASQPAQAATAPVVTPSPPQPSKPAGTATSTLPKPTPSPVVTTQASRVLPTGPTTWTDTKGRRITAIFKALASGNVLLDIAGKVTPVPLNTLSAESQKLARDLAAAQAPPTQGIAGKAFDAITLADIVKAQDLMKIDQIDASDGRVLTVGTVLIYRTCEGRFGKARVEAPAPFKSDVTLFLSWNTFESDGSTRSSGRSFELRRLSSMDLDEGKHASLSNEGDLHWGLQSADSPYLAPVRRNSAAIAIVPSTSPVLPSAAATKVNAPPSSPIATVPSAASKVQSLEGVQAGERKVFMLQSGVEMAFRWIPPGTFLMGSPEAEAFRPVTGENQFEVTLTDGYWMAETECTQAQWEAVTGSGNASYFKGASLPVTNLNWEQAAEFCNQLGEALKLPKPWHGRLPTEAQWEYACRAGTTSSLNDGKSLSGGTLCPNLDKLGWYNANSIGTTHEVARKRPNAWGLHDMHGNVREWCSSWFALYPTRPQRNPRDERSGTARVIRGASFKYSAGGCRAASRDKSTPSEASEGVGFRPILVPK